MKVVLTDHERQKLFILLWQDIQENEQIFKNLPTKGTKERIENDKKLLNKLAATEPKH